MARVVKRNNSYQIRVSCGYTPAGKQIIKTATWTPDEGMTPRQIEKELERQKVLFEERCLHGGSVSSVKFEVLAKEWFHEYAEKNLRVRTIALMHSLEERTYTAIGHLRIDKITTRQIQSFINNLAEPGINKNTGGGLSPKTQSHYLTFISSVFRYAGRMDMVKDNPARRVQIQKAEPKEKQIYTLEEAQQFLELMKQEPLSFQAFFSLAIFGGFRKGEILGLEWKDINFDTCVVTICRSSLYTKGKGVFTDTTKNKSSQRSLKLPESVFCILWKYRAEQNRYRFKLGDQWQNLDRLFTKWNGAPMGSETPYKMLKKFCEKNNFRFLGIHSFRHLNASLLITSGADIKTVSSALGYSQTSTTLNIYAHTFQKAQAEASDAIADLLPLDKKKA